MHTIMLDDNALGDLTMILGGEIMRARQSLAHAEAYHTPSDVARWQQSVDKLVRLHGCLHPQPVVKNVSKTPHLRLVVG